MISDLKRLYNILLIPAVTALLTVYLFRYFDYGVKVPEYVLAIVTPIIFVLSVFFAVAGPIFYRSYFAHQKRNMNQVTEAELLQFERKLIIMAMMTPYLTVISYFLKLPRFYLSGVILLSLYAVYYYYPSKQRITFDKKIFRAMDDEQRPINQD